MTEFNLIAIAADDDRGLDGEVGAHFGGSPFYLLVPVEHGTVGEARVVRNPHHGQHRPGVMPVFIRDLGADVVLAGGMGPRAVAMFRRFGIEVATGAAGGARDVVEAYLRGEVHGIVVCEHDHRAGCGGHSRGSRC